MYFIFLSSTIYKKIRGIKGGLRIPKPLLWYIPGGPVSGAALIFRMAASESSGETNLQTHAYNIKYS